MTTLNIFANQSGQIPLSQLDTNFATPITIGTTDIALGDTATTISGLILSGADLGTPTGNLANCTFPTLNQNTIGTASSVTGLVNVGNGGTGLTSLTSGYIPYGNGAGALSSSSLFNYNGTNLAIGGATGYSMLDVYGATTIRGTLQIQDLSGSSSSASITSTDSSYTSFNVTNSQSSVTLDSNGPVSELRTTTNTPLAFLTNNIEKMRLTSAGFLGIGTSNPAGTLGVDGIVIIGNQAATGSTGTLKLVTYLGTNYIQSGLNTTTASTAPLVFGSINAGDEWLRITSAGGVSFGSSGTAYGSAGQVLISNGNAPPTWISSTISNLTGAVTSVGATTSLGSFTSANLAGALTDETGSGAAVFATSPTLTSPVIAGTPSGVGTLTSATVQNALTTEVLFSSIPSWVKRITVMFNEVSTSGTSAAQVRLGDSGGVENTGYKGQAGNLSVAPTVLSSGFTFIAPPVAVGLYSGSMTLTLLGSNIWAANSIIGRSDVSGTSSLQLCAGTKATSGVLDRVSIRMANGTDTFDAGSINIMYE